MSTTGNEDGQQGVDDADRHDVEPVADESERNTATPAAAEPTHEAVGIGVVDDGSDHHGQDGGRDTLTAGQSQRALSGEQEQRLPAMSQNNASDVDKISGIVAQTRSDVGDQPHDRVVEVLKQRFSDSDISVPDDEVHELADQVLGGDAKTPEQ